MKDVMKEIYEEFPEIEEKSLDKICKVGLRDILKFLRRQEEFIHKLDGSREIKFYLPLNQEKQKILTFRNIRRRARTALKKQNGEKS